MTTLFQDLRYGARILLRNPAFTLVAVLTLALGIGVNTAMFSAVSSFIIRPSHFENPDELAIAFTGAHQDPRVFGDFSYLNYLDYRDRNQVFNGVIAYRMISAAVGNDETVSVAAGQTDRAEVVWGESVSGNYFDVLGRKPALGRGFLPEEDVTPNSHPVVVIGDTIWRRRFTSDPEIIGKTITLNGRPMTVIGVTSKDFVGSKFPLRMEFWIPLMMRSQILGDDSWRTDRSQDMLTIMGRLKPGSSIAQANSDLRGIAASLEREYPKANEGIKVQVVPEREGRLRDAFPVLRLTAISALLLVSLILLIACANVANLLLSRAAARSREIGIRMSLGAGRLRVVRQLLTESVLLSVIGGALGLLFAIWSSELLNATVPPLPFVTDFDFSPDRNTLWWATGLSVLTGIIFGLAPAIYATRTDLVAVTKQGNTPAGGSRSRFTLRNLLLATQFAVSLVVLVSAGLFLRSLNNAKATSPGFSVDNLVSMQIDLELLGYDEGKGKRFYGELLPRIAAIPEVETATLMQVMPLSDNNHSTGPLIKEDEETPGPNQGLFVSFSSIGLNYFETMKTDLLLGRGFTERDDQKAPQVAVVNQELARRLYGGAEAAIGKRFFLGGKNRRPLEIVGVAADGKYRSLYESPRPYLFVPLSQRYYYSNVLIVARARSSANLAGIVEGARGQIQQMDSRLPVFDIKMAAEHLSWAFWGPKLGASLALTFGLLALALAISGLYGVMSYAVSRRTKEVGIRMALGATSRDVVALVIREGMGLVAVGLGIGLIASFAVGRVLVNLLLGVTATDPLTFMAATVLLVITAWIACWIPARRATQVEPLTALRHE